MKLNASDNCLHDVLAQHIEEFLPSVTGPVLPCNCGPECGASAVVSRDVVLCVAVLQVMKTGGGSGLGLRLGFIAPGIVRSGMVHVAVCVCYTANYQILPCSLEYQQFYQLRILTLSPMRGIINLAHVRPRF